MPIKWLPSLHEPGPVRMWRIQYALAACFAVALAGLAVLCVVALVLLHHPSLPRSNVISVHDTVGVAQLVFASVAGAGALVALVVAYRRQRVAEVATRVDKERWESTAASDRLRVFNERFTAIATQLGDEKPAVRLAGVHAMAGLADDWAENRQTCVDVLCACLRLPYGPAPRANAGSRDRAAYQADREVRHTIIRLIGAHLRPDAAWSWESLNFDFTGVVFDGGDFSDARFSGGFVRFDDASFVSGEVSFSGAEFSGGSVSFLGAEFSGSRVSFSRAKLSGGEVYFGGELFGPGAVFSGGKVDFEGAEFSGGRVSFNGAVFSGGEVYFFHTEFCGSHVRFHRSEFSGGRVSFNGAGFSGGEVRFSEARFSGGNVDFADVGFEGGNVSFSSALFSGGEVSFVGAEFTSGTVSFRGNRYSGGKVGFIPGVWSRPPEFDFDLEHPPPGVTLPSDALLRELESLD